jgi:choline transport protein
VWTVGGGLAWAVSFLVLAPKQNADFVVKLFLNNSGYESNGWVFIMSLYTPIFGLYGTDGLLHLLEETKNPSYVAPVSSLDKPRISNADRINSESCRMVYGLL